MKKSAACAGLVLAVLGGAACAKAPSPDYSIKDVPLAAVRFTGGFWAERQKTVASVTIRHEMKECEETGRLRNFDLAAAALGGEPGGRLASVYPFDDSDVFKLIEAASDVLMLRPDPDLEKDIDGWISRIGAAQEADGYLYTARTINPAAPPEMSGPERWSNLSMSHELYNVGHLYEAAAAHFQATGRRVLLDIALKNAGLIDRTFGPGETQLKSVPGHEEIEIGLVKLFRLTGKMKYLDLARFFVEERGRASGRKRYGEYSQDHKPVLEQDEAVGHAVRAAYLYSGTADIAALTGDPRYVAVLEKIWEDVVGRKLYLTGGIGSAGGIEGFGPPYEMGNETGYAETCATIAFALWNHRMFRLTGEAKYMDLFERAAMNAFLSGAGMSGDLFFYPNPLASGGGTRRTPWFKCACCPPNVARFIAGLGGYAYAVADDNVYVNLYGRSTAELATKRGLVRLTQTTDYPWAGDIAIEVAPAGPAAWTLRLRIPEWSLGRPLPGGLYSYADAGPGMPSVKVNGKETPAALDKGYWAVTRTWTRGDIVTLSLPMPVRLVRARAEVASDAGRIAVERGPLVYAAEAVDNGGSVSRLLFDPSVLPEPEFRPGLLGGVVVLTGRATAFRMRNGKEDAVPSVLTLIPYYAWAHRDAGGMAVWLAAEKDKIRPAGAGAEPGT